MYVRLNALKEILFGRAVDWWSRRNAGHSFARNSGSGLALPARKNVNGYARDLLVGNAKKKEKKMRMTEGDGVKWAVTCFMGCGYSECFYRALSHGARNSGN